MIFICASSYRQACLAAEKLGMPWPPDWANCEPRWHYFSDPLKAISLLPTPPHRVVFVRPILGDHVRLRELERVLSYRCQRARVEPEYVYT